MVTKIYSNIVPEEIVRDVQQRTLTIISDAVKKSFGPKGSTTAFVKNMDPNEANIVIEYTKDGHTIVSNILFANPIERSVQDLLRDLTLHIVKEVGDGTTSAVILCKTLFDVLCNNEVMKSWAPSDVVNIFNKTFEIIKDKIYSYKWDCTLDDIYDIALISTNNNVEISQTIKNVYEKYGLDVFIDVLESPEVQNIIKEYDGMTIETGAADSAFNKTVPNARVYCFKDAIDTPEMTNFVMKIINDNIIRAVDPRSEYEYVPTVIMCHQISPDTQSYFDNVINLCKQPGANIPLIIVSDITEDYMYDDIAKMCGAKFIKKYLNLDLQEQDQEKGLAPTMETITDFCGTAEAVTADDYKTKFVKPGNMFDENGEYSDDYKAMVNWLESRVQKAIDGAEGTNEIQNTKRRLNSFKGNMIDFMVGGVTISDRNNLKASVEDAVFNCRSAAKEGVGYGANFMALRALKELSESKDLDNSCVNIINILLKAYTELISILYNITDKDELDKLIDLMIKKKCPLNIRTNDCDGKVKSSIKSDVAILETINKILILMFTSNQYLVQTPMHNIYTADIRDNEG